MPTPPSSPIGRIDLLLAASQLADDEPSMAAKTIPYDLLSSSLDNDDAMQIDVSQHTNQTSSLNDTSYRRERLESVGSIPDSDYETDNSFESEAEMDLIAPSQVLCSWVKSQNGPIANHAPAVLSFVNAIDSQENFLTQSQKKDASQEKVVCVSNQSEEDMPCEAVRQRFSQIAYLSDNEEQCVVTDSGEANESIAAVLPRLSFSDQVLKPFIQPLKAALTEPSPSPAKRPRKTLGTQRLEMQASLKLTPATVRGPCKKKEKKPSETPGLALELEKEEESRKERNRISAKKYRERKKMVWNERLQLWRNQLVEKDVLKEELRKLVIERNALISHLWVGSGCPPSRSQQSKVAAN